MDKYQISIAEEENSKLDIANKRKKETIQTEAQAENKSGKK